MDIGLVSSFFPGAQIRSHVFWASWDVLMFWGDNNRFFELLPFCHRIILSVHLVQIFLYILLSLPYTIEDHDLYLEIIWQKCKQKKIIIYKKYQIMIVIYAHWLCKIFIHKYWIIFEHFTRSSYSLLWHKSKVNSCNICAYIFYSN